MLDSIQITKINLNKNKMCICSLSIKGSPIICHLKLPKIADGYPVFAQAEW